MTSFAFLVGLSGSTINFYIPVENRELTKSKLRCIAMEKRETVLKSALISIV